MMRFVLALLALVSPTLAFAQALPSPSVRAPANDNQAANKEYVDNVVSAIGTTPRSPAARAADVLRVVDRGVKCDGTTDDTAALAEVKTFLEGLGSSAQLPKLVFPRGKCLFTAFPNFAYSNFVIETEGKTYLQYTGGATAYCIRFDGSFNPGGNATKLKVVGRFIINCPASTNGGGILFKNLIHSNVEMTCRGAGASSACFTESFTVANEFRYTCSNNEDGSFYAKPYYCLIAGTGAGAESAHNTYINPVLEGVSIGIFLNYAIGDVFVGGTSEGHSIGGVNFSPKATLNKLFHVDFEVNTTYDVFLDGTNNELVGSISYGTVIVNATAIAAKIDGGRYKDVTIYAGATGTRLANFWQNGVLTNNGTGTAAVALTDGTSGLMKFRPLVVDQENPSIPTSCSGRPPGSIYSNAGVLTLCP